MISSRASSGRFVRFGMVSLVSVKIEMVMDGRGENEEVQ